MNFFRSSLLIIIFTACSPALAQSPAALNPDSGKPIEISAGKTLEWHRNDKKYIARGDAQAQQGGVSIIGETLTADYRETDKSSMDIWRLTAEQSVRIRNETSTAYGDIAVYDVDKGLATLTGSDLKLVSPDQTVTANERMEYWTAKGEASAIGNAKVVRGEDTINAQTIKASFQKNAQGKQEIKRLEAIGNVVIVTPEETLYGDRGTYNASTNMAELTGNVRIERGPNKLQGERAEVNLTTNVSKMFGTQNGGGRVRGIFYPDSKDMKRNAQPSGPNGQLGQ